MFFGQIDEKKVSAILENVLQSPSFNANTRIMVNNRTIEALSGKPFCSDRCQNFQGIPILQNEGLEFGEVVVLTQHI